MEIEYEILKIHFHQDATYLLKPKETSKLDPLYSKIQEYIKTKEQEYDMSFLPVVTDKYLSLEEMKECVKNIAERIRSGGEKTRIADRTDVRDPVVRDYTEISPEIFVCNEGIQDFEFGAHFRKIFIRDFSSEDFDISCTIGIYYVKALYSWSTDKYKSDCNIYIVRKTDGLVIHSVHGTCCLNGFGVYTGRSARKYGSKASVSTPFFREFNTCPAAAGEAIYNDWREYFETQGEILPEFSTCCSADLKIPIIRLTRNLLKGFPQKLLPEEFRTGPAGKCTKMANK